MKSWKGCFEFVWWIHYSALVYSSTLALMVSRRAQTPRLNIRNFKEILDGSIFYDKKMVLVNPNFAWKNLPELFFVLKNDPTSRHRWTFSIFFVTSSWRLHFGVKTKNYYEFPGILLHVCKSRLITYIQNPFIECSLTEAVDSTVLTFQ